MLRLDVSGYSVTVLSCHSCIQPLDVLELVWSTDIQRLNATVTRYHSCTTGFPILDASKQKVKYSKRRDTNV